MSEDGLSWEFTIRNGAKFHNGEPVTAEDVKSKVAPARKLASASSAPRRRRHYRRLPQHANAFSESFDSCEGLIAGEATYAA
jgi:hypothetical protein